MFEQGRRLDVIAIALLVLTAAYVCWQAGTHPTIEMRYQISVALPRSPNAAQPAPLQKPRVGGATEQNRFSGEMKPPGDDDGYDDDSDDLGPPYDDAVYSI